MKHIQETLALLLAYDIKDIILCPGNRNAPIVQTIVNVNKFNIHSITDERSAGFYAIGLSLESNRPTVVCCTSGSALLNLHPAVAEAYYQKVSIIILSADRPEAWIGQMDGQTIPQANVFGSLVSKSINIKDFTNDEEHWFCNRLINEALISTTKQDNLPIHINIQINNPLDFYKSKIELPNTRKIYFISKEDCNINMINSALSTFKKPMIIIGQMRAQNAISIENLKNNFVILSEHLSNTHGTIGNFDIILQNLDKDSKDNYSPDIIITIGGHIVSNRLKKFLRSTTHKEHWHISTEGEIMDLYQCLSKVIACRPENFCNMLSQCAAPQSSAYVTLWNNASAKIPAPKFEYSAMMAVGKIIRQMPENSVLHLANSSSLRYAQLFPIKPSIDVCCNRGVNGIEGSMSAAVGYASTSEKMNVLIIGDLSFFYDMNALWIKNIKPNLRILLINNGGGGIFASLPKADTQSDAYKYIAAMHSTSARQWAISQGFFYASIENEQEIDANITHLCSKNINRPVIIEVFTNADNDTKINQNECKAVFITPL